MNGAVDGTRTRDPGIHSPLLYQLSYHRLRKAINIAKIEKENKIGIKQRAKSKDNKIKLF